MIPRPGQTAKSVALAGALCALFSPDLAHAQGTLVVTSGAVTRTGALYNYSYTVNYTPPKTTPGASYDLFLAEFQTFANAGLSGLSASPGFYVSYDPNEAGSSFVTFLETDGSSTFAANKPVSFSFSSPFAPITRPYDATDGDLNGVSAAQYNYAGTLIAPAPEPGALVALGAGTLGLTLLAVRHRRRAALLAS